MQEVIIEEKELKQLPRMIRRNQNQNNMIIKFQYHNQFYTKPCKELEAYQEYLELIECFNIKDRRQRMEYIYDYLCNYFDKDMREHNYCEFHEDGSCIANRLGYSVHEKDGCCYHQKKGLCGYLTKTGCSNPNPSCKIYMCRYLNEKKKVPNYNTKKILLTKCFFRQRDYEYFKRHYFITKEEFISNYLEKVK